MAVHSLLSSKTSPAHNLSYILFGYYFATIFSYQNKISVEERSIIILFFGSLLGTFIYYVKPFERLLSLYFRLNKNNRIDYDDDPDFTYYVYRSQVFYSPFLQDERVIINGAFFLGIGFICSYGVLINYNIIQFYPILMMAAGLLFLAGFWEIYDLIKRKIHTLMFFYGFYNRSKRIEELKSSLVAKDWNQAERIVASQTFLYDEDDSYEISFCPTCKKQVPDKQGRFCVECGTKLLSFCPECGDSLWSRQGAPKYCPDCGHILST